MVPDSLHFCNKQQCCLLKNSLSKRILLQIYPLKTHRKPSFKIAMSTQLTKKKQLKLSLEGTVENRIRKEGGYETNMIDMSELKITSLNAKAKSALEKCTKLHQLTISDSQLTTLDYFPDLPLLQHLDLSINLLTDQQIPKLTKYKQLVYLSLADNHIKKLESVKHLSKLPKLEKLQLMDNEIDKLPDYTSKVFEWLPGLISLDGKDQNGKQILQDEDVLLQDSDEQESEQDVDLAGDQSWISVDEVAKSTDSANNQSEKKKRSEKKKGQNSDDQIQIGSDDEEVDQDESESQGEYVIDGDQEEDEDAQLIDEDGNEQSLGE